MKKPILALFLALLATPAVAQNSFPTAGNQTVSGHVLMCLDANGNAEPATAAGTCLGSGGGGGGGAVTNAGTFAVQLTGATNNVNNIAGTVSLPTGASTSSLQTTGNTALTTINTTLGTPMQATGGVVGVAPVTSGGLSVYFVQPTASDNHVVIKAGAGQVYKITATNNSATINYIRLYNATTGFNGCGSATNLVYQAAIPGNTSGAGLADSWDLGMAFATGISICVTSGYAQTDTNNATASAISLNVGYK